MNFHCYGNIWIHPFNYMHEKHKYPENTYANIIKFYEDFKGEVAQVSKSDYGNAIETVNYSTDGEASDWMLGEHKIIAFSPELGSFNPLAQTFFLPKDLIYEVIEENYKVIDLFLRRNNFEIKNLSYGLNNKNEFQLEFRNTGLANLFNPVIMIESVDKELLSNINKIMYRSGGDVDWSESKFIHNKDFGNNSIVFSIDKIDRLEEFFLSFEFNNHSVLKTAIEFDAKVMMKDGKAISQFSVSLKPSNLNIFIAFYAVAFIIILFIVLSMFLRKIFSLRLKKKMVKDEKERKESEPVEFS